MTTAAILAVDIGNSRLKVGQFTLASSDPPPNPQRVWALQHGGSLDDLTGWLGESFGPPPWSPVSLWIVSQVKRSVADDFLAWLARHDPQASVHVVSQTDIGLPQDLPEPETTGTDRLLAAWAASRISDPGVPTIVIDFGSALTVNLVSAEGIFLGGAILPGLQTSADALAAMSPRLPRIDIATLNARPHPVGRTTRQAVESGLIHGAVGAVRELVHQISRSVNAEPAVYCTGGLAPLAVSLLTPTPRFEPHLTLQGLKLAADRRLAARS
jgi:type III pantothenate kinase